MLGSSEIMPSHSLHTFARWDICSWVNMCGAHTNETRFIFNSFLRMPLIEVGEIFRRLARLLLLKWRSSQITAATVFTLTGVIDVLGLPPCGINVADTRPYKNALCHLKTVARWKHSFWYAWYMRSYVTAADLSSQQQNLIAARCFIFRFISSRITQTLQTLTSLLKCCGTLILLPI